jgi:hypothetical protein
MENPLARVKGLAAYTVEELEDRAHELWIHSRQLQSSPVYVMKYMRGEVPDPMEGYRHGDPWYDLTEIERHLKGRLT